MNISLSGFYNCIHSVAEDDIELAFAQCSLPSRSGSAEFDRKASDYFARNRWHDADNWQEAASQYFKLLGAQLYP